MEVLPNPEKIDFIQPWSNYVLRVKLRNEVVNKIKQLYIENVKSKINLKELLENKYVSVLNFFYTGIRQYYLGQIKQKLYGQEEEFSNILKEDLLIDLNNFKFITKQNIENNLNPERTGNKVKVLIYLKITENKVGTITFINNNSIDNNFTINNVNIKPIEGDMFLMSSLQPYLKSSNENNILSLSFEADFIYKSYYLIQEKQKQEYLSNVKNELKQNIISNIKNKNNNKSLNKKNGKTVVKNSTNLKNTNIKKTNTKKINFKNKVNNTKKSNNVRNNNSNLNKNKTKSVKIKKTSSKGKETSINSLISKK